jgi:hypothetical protein
MELQTNQHDELKIPRIVPFLADAVHQMNGQQSEGIFRVPGDADDVTDLVSLSCYVWSPSLIHFFFSF